MRFKLEPEDAVHNNKCFATVRINDREKFNLPSNSYSYSTYDSGRLLLFSFKCNTEIILGNLSQGLKLERNHYRLALVNSSNRSYYYYKIGNKVHIGTINDIPQEAKKNGQILTFDAASCSEKFAPLENSRVLIDPKDIISSKNITASRFKIQIGEEFLKLYDPVARKVIGILNNVVPYFDRGGKLRLFPSGETFKDSYLAIKKLGDNYVGCISDENGECRRFYKLNPDYFGYEHDSSPGPYPYYYNLENLCDSFDNLEIDLEVDMVNLKEFEDLKAEVGELKRAGARYYPGAPGPAGPPGPRGEKGDRGLAGKDADLSAVAKEILSKKRELGEVIFDTSLNFSKGKTLRQYFEEGIFKQLEKVILEVPLEYFNNKTFNQFLEEELPKKLIEDEEFIDKTAKALKNDTQFKQDVKGDQGIQGLKGDMGDKGNTGAQGMPGLKGDVGPKGDRGEPGTKGLTGNIGAKGPAGPKGLPGKDGAQGIQGLPGLDGLKGDTGPRGNTGAPGSVGPQGVAGAPGKTGSQGKQGLRGPVGKDGARGIKGKKGDIGPKGDQGPIGFNGTHGLQGTQGQKGDSGAQGLPGPKGERGDNGTDANPEEVADKLLTTTEFKEMMLNLTDYETLMQELANSTKLTQSISEELRQNPGKVQGPKGDKGNQGLQGLMGEKGVAGTPGPKGDMGIQGLKGDQGPRGFNGTQGLPGLDGLKGDQGIQGLKGEKGDPGSKGLQGRKGIDGLKGDQGLQGLKGNQGVAGAPGPQGLPGKDGAQGPKGLPGSAGAKGKDGINAALTDQFLREMNRTKIEIQGAKNAAEVAKISSEKSAKEAQDAEGKVTTLHDKTVDLAQKAEKLKNAAREFATQASQSQLDTLAFMHQTKDMFCTIKPIDQICAAPRGKREISNPPMTSRPTSFISEVINFFYPSVGQDEYKVKNKIQEINQAIKIINSADIVTKFEKMLGEAALKCGIAKKNLKFDPLKLEKEIVSKFNDGNRNELLKFLCSAAEKACPRCKQTQGFSVKFKDSMERTLNEQQRDFSNTEVADNERPRSFMSDVTPSSSFKAINQKVVGRLG